MEQEEEIVQIGWYCRRCKGLVAAPCRSDNVPVLIPREWEDEMRTEIIRLDEEEATVWQPPPPGDKRDQLPDDILALIVLRPYVSTSCETAQALESAMIRWPDRRAELAMWRDRKHASCRLNNKSTGVLCSCPHHDRDKEQTA